MAERGAGQPMWALSPTTLSVTYRGNAGTGSNWFGPLTPMAPQAPPEVAGRQYDFLPGVNIQTTPKAFEGVGFPELRGLADGYDLLRLVIETRKDQVDRMAWTIKPREGKRGKTRVDARTTAIEAFFRRPNGVDSWGAWLRMVLEDLFVVDAPALYCERTRGGQLLALHPLDGATIKKIVDDWGRTPRPVASGGSVVYPAAYQQVLKGYPAVDYTTRDLIYRPRNVRTNRAYGYGPVEQIMMTVNIALRRQLFTLQYFTEGNVPEALIGVPDTWSPDQIVAFQAQWDAYQEGNLAQRRHAKFVPAGVGKTFITTKEPELKGPFDEWLAKVVCFAFSISPQALVSQVNRATANTQKEMAEEEGLAPVLAWIKGLVDDILAAEFDAADLEFDWTQDTQSDPAQEAEILKGYVGAGVMTLNEARDRLGLDPLDDDAANAPMVLTGTGYVPIDANTIAGKQANLDAFGPPPAPVAPNSGSSFDGAAQTDGGSKPDQRAPAEKHAHATSPFNKRRPGGAADPIPFDRPTTVEAIKTIGAVLTKALAGEAKECAAAVRAGLARLGKADGPEDAPDIKGMAEDAAAVVAAGIVAHLALSKLTSDAVVSSLADDLGTVASDSVERAIASIGVEIASELVDQVNDRAVGDAADRAAELVGMRRVPVPAPDGGPPSFRLVPNPSAEWAITDTTRDMVREIITTGLVDNIGTPAIAERIMTSVAFSAERAELVAETEVARANSNGAMAGYRSARDDAGVGLRKAWLITVEACRVCQGNADQGPIDLDQPFRSGDDAPPGHPKCRCAILPVVDDEVTKAAGWVWVEDDGDGLAKYNPAQPRDERGRWLRTGSEGAVQTLHTTAADLKTRGVIFDRGRETRAKGLAAYNKLFRKPPEALKAAILKGATGVSAEKSVITVTNETWDRTPQFSIAMSVRNEEGVQIARLERRFSTQNGKLNVEHAFFEVDKGQQRTGLSKTLLHNSMAEYKAMGVSTVTVHANIDVGGYAWAKYGFAPTDVSWSSLKFNLSTRLDGLRDQVSDTQYATAKRILSSDDPTNLHKVANLKSAVRGASDQPQKLGQALLLGSNWYGTLDLSDKKQMARFNRYASKR